MADVLEGGQETVVEAEFHHQLLGQLDQSGIEQLVAENSQKPPMRAHRPCNIVNLMQNTLHLAGTGLDRPPQVLSQLTYNKMLVTYIVLHAEGGYLGRCPEDLVPALAGPVEGLLLGRDQVLVQEGLEFVPVALALVEGGEQGVGGCGVAGQDFKYVHFIIICPQVQYLACY